jgi:hypothetical protein
MLIFLLQLTAIFVVITLFAGFTIQAANPGVHVDDINEKYFAVLGTLIILTMFLGFASIVTALMT